MGTDPMRTAGGVSRRDFLVAGGTVAAGAALSPLLDPLNALASGWPKGQLGARDARTVNRDQFMARHHFRQWHEELDDIGPAG